MTKSASTRLNPAAVIGIAIGAGALLTLILVVGSVKIYKTRRNNRFLSRRDDDGPQQIETIEVPTKTLYGRNLRSPGNAPDRYSALDSNESVHRLYLPSLPGNTHSAFQPDHGARIQMSSAIRFFGARRSSSRGRQVKTLSAIIESPQGQNLGTPSASTAYIHVDPPSRAQSDIIAEGSQLAGNGQDLSPEGSPESPWQAKVRRYPLSSLGVSPVSKIKRPLKAVRSKSAGTLLPGLLQHRSFSANGSDSARPIIHHRSISFGSTLVGPAPAGPLPPLPSFAPLTERTLPRFEDTSERGHVCTEDTANENWEKIPLGLFSGRGEVQALYMSKGSTRLSRNSTHSTVSSISSIRTSLDDRHFNRLSIPRIEMAERLSVSRISSSGSIHSDGSLRMVSAPARRRLAGSRVTSFGSPTGKQRVMHEVSGNASTVQPRTSPLKDAMLTTCQPFDFDSELVASKPSALKGSPGSKKGHKRQNCVRISTLAPTVLGYASSRSSSPFSMDEIREENEDGACTAMNSQHKAVQLRASLMPTSANLSMSGMQYEQDSSLSARALPPSSRFGVGNSTESSLYSLVRPPSYAGSGCASADEDLHGKADPPAMIFTRPSSEWVHDELSSSPPFALHVTPNSSLADACEMKMTGRIPGRNHGRPEPERAGKNASGDGTKLEEMQVHKHKSLRILKHEHNGKAEPNGSVDLPCAPRSFPACLTSSPPLVDVFSSTSYLGNAQAIGRTSEEHILGMVELRRDSDKENAAPQGQSPQVSLRSAADLPSPFKSAPILRPRSTIDIECQQSSAAPSPPSSPSPRPPIPRRNVNRKSVLQAGKADSSRIRKPSPSRESRLGGPRPAPARDLRRAIIELRRGNSEMLDLSNMSSHAGSDSYSKNDSPSRSNSFDQELDDLDADCSYDQEMMTWGDQDVGGSERYLNLGREAPVVLPYTEHVYTPDFATPTSTYSTVEPPGFDFGFDIRPLSFAPHAQQRNTIRPVSASAAQTDFELGLDDDPPLDVMLEPSRSYCSISDVSGGGGGLARDGHGNAHRYIAYSPPQNSDFPQRRDGDVDDLVMDDTFTEPTAFERDFLTPIREAALESDSLRKSARVSAQALSRAEDVDRSGGSVWDDGERYWQEVWPQGSSPSRLDGLRSPRGTGDLLESQRRLSMALVGGGAGGVVERGSERGLYDENGFLRSSPLRQAVL